MASLETPTAYVRNQLDILKKHLVVGITDLKEFNILYSGSVESDKHGVVNCLISAGPTEDLPTNAGPLPISDTVSLRLSTLSQTDLLDCAAKIIRRWFSSDCNRVLSMNEEIPGEFGEGTSKTISIITRRIGN